jgi:predicted permease
MPAEATHVLAAGPGFFNTMKITLLAGREFDERDHQGAPPVAIVNQAWVKANGEGRNPSGQHVVSYWARMKPLQMEIVGVVKDARYGGLRGNLPAIVYMPFEQYSNAPVDEVAFFLRTSGDPLACAAAVRRIAHQADPRIPVTNLGTQAQQIDEQMAQEILFARLCTGFAVLALTIACVGLYGTMSYTVARRSGEIGIRMALGARRGDLIWMVLREVLALAWAGLAVSVPAALAGMKLVESFLFGITPYDAPALASAAAILVAAALLAGYIPARGAAGIDPIAAVRHE